MKDLRIVSFLPAATEMVYCLGLGDQLVGVSHECDFPEDARAKPVVVRPALDLERLTLGEIDAAVARQIGSGASLYQVDERLLRDLAPTHILTQALCQVCAPSGNEIAHLLKTLAHAPEIVWFTPKSLEDVDDNLRELGRRIGRRTQAEQILADQKARLQALQQRTAKALRRPRVFCLEWVDPYYCCGHWVPQMVEFAGGIDSLGRRGSDSVRVSWSQIVDWSPEIIIVMPCGFGIDQAAGQAIQLLTQPGWREIPAVRNDRIFAVHANAYFARPGPRLVQGAELLAHLIHPELCDWTGPAAAFRKIPAPRG